MPVPLEFLAFFLAMSHFNLERWVMAQWRYPIISRPEPWGKQSEWSEKLITPWNRTALTKGTYGQSNQREKQF